MKKFLSMLLIGAMTVSMCIGCSSEKEEKKKGVTSLNGEELPADVKEIVEDGVLKVGVKNNVKGFGFQDTLTQKYSGLEVELGKMIADELGIDVEYTTVTAATRSELLDSGELHCVLATFTITDERRESWDFTTPYYTDAVTVLVEDAKGIKSLEDIKGKTVGVSSGSTSARALVAAMVEQGLLSGDGFNPETFDAATWRDGVSFRQYDDYPAISTALGAHEVDAFCVDKSILSIYKTEGRSFIEDKFAPQEYGIATTKDSGISKVCEDLVTKWLEDGTIEELISSNGIE